jgi:hydrogenase nickel incorporation protein HypB
MCDTCGCGETEAPESKDEEAREVIGLEDEVLGKNQRYAEANRRRLKELGIVALNLISSPGSGKTTLLERTLRELAGEIPCAVIEGDQQTDRDARRIAATGVPVAQINTQAACHIDAHQLGHALDELDLAGLKLLFIENVGNLVCPAAFDLGECAKVVLLSVTEGEDKPVKYPLIFHLAQRIVFTKIDLLPHLEFDLEESKRFALSINPKARFIETSARTGEGMAAWLEWLRSLV